MLLQPRFFFVSPDDVALLCALRLVGVIVATSEGGHAMAPESGGDFMVCR
jgi:hypothetical protein